MFIIIFVFILGLLILVHELGHFIAAKKNGIMVEEFGFGLPPRLFGKKIGETLYSINLLPIGGFVKLYGEEYWELTKTKTNAKLKNKAFYFKKPWQKASVVIAGVIGNFILGWFLISFLFTKGVPTPTNKVFVERVLPNSPAYQAGLKEKDVITRIIKPPQEEYPIKSVSNLTELTKKFAGEKIIIVIDRKGKIIQTEIIPRKNPPQNEGPLGVVITSFVEKKYPLYQAPFYGLAEAVNVTKQIIRELFRTVFKLVTFQKPKIEVTGPIGIARYTNQAVRFGQNAVLELIALLSLNLAVINILPFPALDGGRLIFVIYEWVTKRKVDENLERNLNLVGIIILISLALIISINDIIKIYK